MKLRAFRSITYGRLSVMQEDQPPTELLDFLDVFRKQVEEGNIDGIAIAYTMVGYTGRG